jgi:hypothetical protein
MPSVMRQNFASYILPDSSMLRMLSACLRLKILYRNLGPSCRCASYGIRLAREGSLPPRLGLTQAELSGKSNQVVRARIRQFESDMPSQAVSLRRHLQAGLEIASRVRANRMSASREKG